MHTYIQLYNTNRRINMDNSPATQGFFHLPAFPPVLAIPSSHSDDDASSLRGTLATSSSDFPRRSWDFPGKKKRGACCGL